MWSNNLENLIFTDLSNEMAAFVILYENLSVNRIINNFLMKINDTRLELALQDRESWSFTLDNIVLILFKAKFLEQVSSIYFS